MLRRQGGFWREGLSAYPDERVIESAWCDSWRGLALSRSRLHYPACPKCVDKIPKEDLLWIRGTTCRWREKVRYLYWWQFCGGTYLILRKLCVCGLYLAGVGIVCVSCCLWCQLDLWPVCFLSSWFVMWPVSAELCFCNCRSPCGYYFDMMFTLSLCVSVHPCVRMWVCECVSVCSNSVFPSVSVSSDWHVPFLSLQCHYMKVDLLKSGTLGGH